MDFLKFKRFFVFKIKINVRDITAANVNQYRLIIKKNKKKTEMRTQTYAIKFQMSRQFNAFMCCGYFTMDVNLYKQFSLWGKHCEMETQQSQFTLEQTNLIEYFIQTIFGACIGDRHQC